MVNNNTMRVAVYYNNRDIRIEEKPVPPIGPDEILMQVEASGICGSDVLEWYRINRAPLVLGHEVAGKVAAAGKNVTKYQKGDRIAAAHHVPCNTCHYCLSGHQTVCDTLRQTNFDPGGFAEYLRLPAINVDRGVFLLPDRISYEEATFIEPLACVLRGQKIARVQPGCSVLVMGSGIAGLLHVQLAKATGARFIAATDINHYRLDMALRVGADVALHAEDDILRRIKEENNGALVDVVIVSTGSAAAINQSLQAVDRGGIVLFFAPTAQGVTFPVSINDLFFRNDVTLTTSYAGSPTDYAIARDLIGSGRIKVNGMITHRLPLAETGKGFQLVAGAEESLKVIIQPQK